MKKILFILGLATGLVTRLFAGETLHLSLVPDRDCILKGKPQEVVVKIDLSAITDHKKHQRTPLNLGVVIDRSGSMAGAKLEKTKQAALQLVDRLDPKDVFSLVVFSSGTQVLIPAQHVTDKDYVRRVIEGISADGSTALYAGVKSGSEQLQEYFSAKRINRIILLSDGMANVGPSSPRALRELGSELSQRGVSVTTIGVGDDYNEDVMASLAEASDANYYYVKDTEKLPDIFNKELGELLAVAARDIRIEITCPEGVKPIGFIGRPEKFSEQTATVKLSSFTSGQNRYLMLRCLVSDAKPEVANVHVHYKDELDGGSEQTASAVATIHFSEDLETVNRSLNATVNAQKQLMLTAVAKDEAMEKADLGLYKEASSTIARQKMELKAAYADAPAPVQEQMRQEFKNIDTISGNMTRGLYDSAARKDMQSQSFSTRNSKSYDNN